MFYKINMTGDKNFVSLWVKTIKGVMSNGVAKKDTRVRARFQFMVSIGTKPGIIKTTKNTKRSVIRIVMK